MPLFLALNYALLKIHPKDFVWRWDEAVKMVGLPQFQELCQKGAAPADLEPLFTSEAARFNDLRKPYLLYP